MASERPHRYTIAVDFDGVLHRYDSPWVKPHIIPDGPVEGAMAWLHKMIRDFDIVIHSTRARTWRGRRAMRRWLLKHCSYEPVPLEVREHVNCDLDLVKFSYKKPAALIYVDDRAYRFDGKNWPTKEEIHRARPWNK